MPTIDDVQFIIRESGSVAAALRYCTRLAKYRGPLSNWYAAACEILRKNLS